MELALATANPNKIREIASALSAYFRPIFPMSELYPGLDLPETGATLEENSFMKADAACRLSGLPALADDSGLSVDALNGAPGVHSARYAGIPANDSNNIDKLLREMLGIENRKAEFVTVLTLCFPSGRVIRAKGSSCGEITDRRRGSAGFGYDPVFYSADLKATFAEAGLELKNAVSHRAKALARLKAELDRLSLRADSFQACAPQSPSL